MTLKQRLQVGIEAFLEDENAKIVQFNSDHYQAAREFVDNYGSVKLDEITEQHGDQVASLISEGVDTRREKLLEQIADNSLNVRLVVNNNELYVPIGLSNRTGLEEDVYDYLGDLMRSVSDKTNEGSFSRFVSFDAHKHINALKTENLPEAFGLANVKFCHDSIIIPQLNGSYSDDREVRNLPYVELKVAPDSRKYGLLTVTKEAQGFFPGYKSQFLLETDVKPFVMHLSSSEEGTRNGDNVGNYINHPRTTEIEERFLDRAPDATDHVAGSFLRWYDAHPEIQADDLVRIHRIGDEHFRLEL